ncbi:MAG: 50S ribosomal protein L29 [Candidatus Portnoybacteria bacterium]
MRIKELRQKSGKELSQLLTENRKKIGQLRFDLASKKLKNVNQIKELRRDVARITTLTKEQKNGK